MGQFFLICWFILETEAQICSAPMTAEKANELFADAAKYQTYIYIKQAETGTDTGDIASQMKSFLETKLPSQTKPLPQRKPAAQTKPSSQKKHRRLEHDVKALRVAGRPPKKISKPPGPIMRPGILTPPKGRGIR
jgi:hypothetical protein